MEQDPLSPRERALFDDLAGVIEEELTAQIAVGRFDADDGASVTAGLIADVVWQAFRVRSREPPRTGADDAAASSTPLRGQEVDAAEIEYDRAEQMYLAGVRKRLDRQQLADRATKAELSAGLWAESLRCYATDKRQWGLPAEATAQEAEVVESFLRAVWKELAEAHRLDWS